MRKAMRLLSHRRPPHPDAHFQPWDTTKPVRYMVSALGIAAFMFAVYIALNLLTG